MTSSYDTEIGKILTHAREDLHLTLQQASAALHIRAHYLHALEEGDLSDLPGMAYTKGYLQSYAVFLRLDKEEILRRFELVENALPESRIFFPKVFSKEEKPSYSAIWVSLTFVVFVYLLWFFLFKPESTKIHIITKPPPIIEKEDVATDSVLNLSCVLHEVRVYPNCYRADADKAVEGSLLPLRRQINSVMELAY